MMDLDKLLAELDRVLDRRIEEQRRKLVKSARRLKPGLAYEDLQNPADHPELKGDGAFTLEDGTLSGLLSAREAIRDRMRELGAGGGDAARGMLDRVDHDTGAIPYRHCPRCGGALELRLLVAHDPERLTCVECTFVFYLDPKVAAGAILTLDDEIVLARRDIEPRVGSWGFPSGYVDRGERIEDAASREVREEVGLEASMERLIGVYSYSGRPVVVVVFAGRVTGGKLVAGDETSEVGTFPPDRIPWEDLAFSSTRQALEDYLEAPPGR